MKVNLPSSPPRDAPSPTAFDDPFEQGIEATILEARKEGTDRLESIDMDLGEDGEADLSAHVANNLVHDSGKDNARIILNFLMIIGMVISR